MNVSNERLGKKLNVIIHDAKGTILYLIVLRRLQYSQERKAVFP